MKTPWRFVADLVSRKPKTESQEKTLISASAPIALEYKAAEKETHTGNLGTATTAEETSPAQQPEPQPAPVIVETATSADEDVSDISVAEPVATSTSPLLEEASSPSVEIDVTQADVAEAPKTAIPARRRKIETTAKPTVSMNGAAEVVPAVASGPKSFTDEMSDLDAEVDALRRQLAEKLIQQNAQLRKMLSRFDAR